MTLFRSPPSFWLAAILCSTLAGCIDADDTAPEAVARETTLPSSCDSGQGQVEIQNLTRQVVTATITESSGLISSLTIPPGHHDIWNVDIGATTITATAPGLRDPLLSTELDVGCDTLVTTEVHPANFVLPTSMVMTTVLGGQRTEGVFACGTARSRADVRRSLRGHEIEYTLTCNDPDSARGSRTLAVRYPASAVVDGTAPEPMQACLEHFAVYKKPSSSLPYFKAELSPYGLTCKADSTAGGTPSFVQIAPDFYPPMTGGDLSIVRHHVKSDPDATDGYDTYHQETSLFSGTTGNTIKFRYRNKTIGSWPNVKLMLQISLEPSGPMDPWDTCDGWFAIPELVESKDIAMTVDGVAPFEATFKEFKQHLSGPAIYYARVVPYLVDGFGEPMCVDGVSNWVSLVVVEDDPEADLDAVWNAAHAVSEAKHAANMAKQGYQIEALSYLAPVLENKTSDAYLQQIITKDNPQGWPVGCAYKVPSPQPSKPWYKVAWDGVGSVIDYINSKWDELHSWAVDSTVGNIPGCSGVGSLCREAIVSGLSDAHLAVRIPKRLPNGDDVIYAAAPLTARFISRKVGKITNTPDLDLFLQLMGSVAQHVSLGLSGGSGVNAYDRFTWGKPDPFYYAYPAVVWVKVSRDPDPAKIYGNSFWLTDPNHIWKSRFVQLPDMEPGAVMTIPFFLEPRIKEIYSSSAFQSYNDQADYYYWLSSDWKFGSGLMNLKITTDIGSWSIVHPAGADWGTYGKLQPAPVCP